MYCRKKVEPTGGAECADQPRARTPAGGWLRGTGVRTRVLAKAG